MQKLKQWKRPELAAWMELHDEMPQAAFDLLMASAVNAEFAKRAIVSAAKLGVPIAPKLVAWARTPRPFEGYSICGDSPAKHNDQKCKEEYEA